MQGTLWQDGTAVDYPLQSVAYGAFPPLADLLTHFATWVAIVAWLRAAFTGNRLVRGAVESHRRGRSSASRAEEAEPPAAEQAPEVGDVVRDPV